MDKSQEFNEYRTRMNNRIIGAGNKILNRIWSLDSQTFAEGALPRRTKEMLGLVSSMVLRCDDCIKYHIEQCFKQDITEEELLEVISIANLVGGTIVIPHTRRAVEYWDELNHAQQA